MTRPLASLIGALAATGVLAAAGPCLADAADATAFGGGYSASEAPLGAPVELTLDLRGQVPARCQVTTPPAGLTGFDLNAAGEAQSAFAVDCNAPFLMRVRSERGGFGTDTSVANVEALAPYRMAVSVGTDAGRQDLGWCEASALVAQAAEGCAYGASAPLGGWSSGDATAIRQSGSVTLRWNAPARGQARLGAYQDVIVIEMEVRA